MSAVVKVIVGQQPAFKLLTKTTRLGRIEMPLVGEKKVNMAPRNGQVLSVESMQKKLEAAAERGDAAEVAALTAEANRLLTEQLREMAKLTAPPSQKEGEKVEDESDWLATTKEVGTKTAAFTGDVAKDMIRAAAVTFAAAAGFAAFNKVAGMIAGPVAIPVAVDTDTQI